MLSSNPNLNPNLKPKPKPKPNPNLNPNPNPNPNPNQECAIVGDGCDSELRSEEACSTAHCVASYDDWDNSDELHELWGCVLEAQDECCTLLDYDACICALGGGS